MKEIQHTSLQMSIYLADISQEFLLAVSMCKGAVFFGDQQLRVWFRRAPADIVIFGCGIHKSVLLERASEIFMIVSQLTATASMQHPLDTRTMQLV
jgi:hypothetical protein